MTIIRRPELNAPFVSVQMHYLRDQHLSLRAMGLLTYLLSLPPNWRMRPTELTTHFTEGKDAFYGVLRQLREHDYVRVRQERCDTGKFTPREYFIAAKPFKQWADETELDLPDADTPDRDTPPLYKKETPNEGIDVKDKKQNNDKRNTQNNSTSQGQFTRTLDFQTQLRIKAHLDKVLQFTEQQMALPRYGKFLAGIYASLCYAKGFGNTEISKAINSIGKLVREGRWQTPMYYTWANEHCEVMNVIAQMQAFYQELNESRNTLKSQLCKYDVNYRSKQEARVRHAESQIAALQARLSVDVTA